MSVWEQVFDCLKQAGFEVYPPATKQGECHVKYIVVKKDGSAQVGTYSSEFVYYQFLLYVPQNKYHELDEYSEAVKEVIGTELYPMLMPTDSEIGDYYDDSIKAHMRTLMYRNSVRNKHL